ncbi:MAG: thrombospondin type 3 repeat-containing protein [Candidatus Falkowbacteria bacterium]|nr:thrombospondin type 3 repeat-containing protein [Candidatus Falkowbacteria bacterium]
MFLQVRKNKKVKDTDSKNKGQELSERINQDIVVHNMPSKSVLANSTYSQNSNHSVGSDNADKHKKIGLFIIGGGLVAILGIIYLAYIFIIKPAAQPSPNSQAPVASSSTANQVASAVAPAPVEPTPSVNINEANIPISTSTELATSSASSTLVFPGEEKIIKSVGQPILDSDNDGLNDSEEAILGTDPKLSDSDGDGFPDLAELLSGYNPAGTGKLTDDSNLAKYSVANYEILYPKTWTLKPLTTDASVIFSAPDESFVQLSVQKNTDALDIEVWYQKEFAVATIPSTQLISNSIGTGVLSDDGLTAYFTDVNRNNIYVLDYTPLDAKNLAYPDIFKLMINSLTLKK